jgi:hypothetical protein
MHEDCIHACIATMRVPEVIVCLTQVSPRMMIIRIILPHFISIARAEIVARTGEVGQKPKRITVKQNEETWKRRERLLSLIPQHLLVTAGSFSRHNSGSDFVTVSLPGGEQGLKEWSSAEEQGLFPKEVDSKELWRLFHPAGKTLHFQRCEEYQPFFT